MQALEVAKYIINKAIECESPVSNLTMLKILYITHREFLKQTGRKLITDEKFEAWQWGGVIREVYIKWSLFGSNKLDIDYQRVNLRLNESEKRIVDKTIKHCLNLHSWELVQEAKPKGGAWERVYRDGLGDKEYIPDEFIAEEAKTLKSTILATTHCGSL